MFKKKLYILFFFDFIQLTKFFINIKLKDFLEKLIK